MPHPFSLKLVIHGKFPEKTMIDWILHRAGLLDLSGWVRFHNETCIEMVAIGDRILVEALEVACSLGPASAQVDSIICLEPSRHEVPGRHAKQFVRYSCPGPRKLANHQ